jgi:general L-amino acid transport system permease protein
MTVLADPPKPSFRLSQLLYDTRYRSLTIQVFALLLIVLLIAFLVVNVITNLHPDRQRYRLWLSGGPLGL